MHKNSKIVFIDDDPNSVEQLVEHLKRERYSNTHSVRDVESYNEALNLDPALMFLDISGVGTSLDSESEGASILSYYKKHRPWIPVVVLSGNEYNVTRVPELSQADKDRGERAEESSDEIQEARRPLVY